MLCFFLYHVDRKGEQQHIMKTSTLEHKSNRIQGQEGFIYIDDGGVGNVPVIFLHSFGGSTSHWKDQLDHLRASRRAIAFDFRGHGNSDSSSMSVYTSEALAGDIAAVVDSLDLERFILVGHSMGGSAAVAYADTHPVRVAGLVLAGTPGKTPEEISKAVVSALESDAYQKVMDDYMKQLLQDAAPQVSSVVNEGVKKLSRKTTIKITQALFEFDPIDKIKKYPGPKFIISTSNEVRQPNALSGQLPGVPCKIINGASHWLQLDKPQEFNKILDDLLAQIDRHNK